MSTLYLVRGLPGSGKSSFGARLAPQVFSADDYFMVDGRYQFDPGKLSDAHASCLWRTGAWLEDRYTAHVAVANTFPRRWELEPYLQLAAAGGHELFVVDLYDGGLTDEQLAARNVHGVPVTTIANMRARWEHNWRAGNPLPPWQR